MTIQKRQRKTWILTTDTSTPILLGQLLHKPFEPSLPILFHPLPLPPASITSTSQTAVKSSSNNVLGHSFSLWAEISLLPVSGHLGTTNSKDLSQKWEFDRLDSEVLNPTKEDIQAALETPEVVDAIQRKKDKWDFRKRLYMVTGIRTARGVRHCKTSAIAKGVNAGVGVDLTAIAAAPLNIGPEIEVEREKEEDYSFEGASDFVFAYRVCEVHYGKNIYAETWNRGDAFAGGEKKETGSDEDEIESDEEDDEEVRLLVEGVSDDLAGVVGSEKVELTDGGFDEDFVIARRS